MACIVLVPGRVRSKLITVCELGIRLKRAGFDVAVVTTGPEAEEVEGLQSLHAELTLHPDRGAGVLGGSRRQRVERCRALVEAADVDGLARRLGELGPDLVLIDIEAHAETMAAVTAGFRVGLINVFFNLWKHPRVPPVHVPITPGVGLAGSRFGIEWAWLRYRIWRWCELRRSRMDGNDFLTRLEAFAGRLGYPLDQEVDYYQGLLPWLYRNLPILNSNVLELDFPHTPQALSHYVGPMISENRNHLGFARDEQVVADAITDIVSTAVAAGNKVIYCAFGAYFFGDDSTFWGRITAAAAKRPDWCFLLGLGGRVEPGCLESVPANVHAFRWAPQLFALEKADAAIVHGGMTSIYECLFHGVPVLSYPFADIFDQFGTAARVRYHGVGIVGHRYRDTPAKIVAQLEQLLNDRAILARVASFQALIRRYRSENRLEQAVSGMIAGTMSTSNELVENALSDGR